MSLYRRFQSNSRNRDTNLDHTLKDFIYRSDNKGKCCECLSPSIKYISITFHCILCSRCGNGHMDVLPESFVKATEYQDDWTKDDIRSIMKSGGNRENKALYNSAQVPFPYDADFDKLEVETFLRDKYILGKYIKGGRKPELLYGALCRSDENHNLENRNKFQEKRNQSFDKNLSLSAPSLPSKPRPNNQPSSAVFVGEEIGSSSLFSQPKTAVFDGSVELHPFYDQSSGQIYVDREQYHKYEQQQQNATQNQQIMSMYNHPGVYQSGVEIGPNQPQYQAIADQQSYLQQQMQNPQYLQQQNVYNSQYLSQQQMQNTQAFPQQQYFTGQYSQQQQQPSFNQQQSFNGQGYY
ncbi:hypothetical protein QEN19_003153 [Hanseniaspora menglaensis]